MDKDGLMTDREFDSYLRTWAQRVEMSARMNLAMGTHGTGNLEESLQNYVDRMRNGIGRHVKFTFPQYGVFRAYGAGRGWVVVNGVPVKGKRVLSTKEIREHKMNDLATNYLKKGYRMSEIKKMKVADAEANDPRRPLNWIDKEIASRQEELADMSASFFGDKSLEVILAELDKAKIVKQR